MNRTPDESSDEPMSKLLRRSPFVLALALAGVAACYPLPRVASIWPTPSPVANYTLGSAATVGVGGVLVDRTDGSQILPGFMLQEPLQVLGTDRQPPEGQSLWFARFEYHGACPDGRYVVTSPGFYEERIGIIVGEDGSVSCDPPVVQLVGGNRGRTWRLAQPLPLQPFLPVPLIAAFEPDAVRWQLVYRGGTARRIELEYRELRGAMDDAATPAATQQLHFDLSPSRTIRFHDTEIEVLRATGRDITYRVLRDASPATPIPPADVTRGPR